MTNIYRELLIRTATRHFSRSMLCDQSYAIKKVLGQGGFGRTYLVEDQKSFNKYRVLKEFVPSATSESAQ